MAGAFVQRSAQVAARAFAFRFVQATLMLIFPGRICVRTPLVQGLSETNPRHARPFRSMSCKIAREGSKGPATFAFFSCD